MRNQHSWGDVLVNLCLKLVILQILPIEVKYFSVFIQHAFDQILLDLEAQQKGGDMALSPNMLERSKAMKHMFTFTLRSTRKGIVTGNHFLADEATSIVILCMLQFINIYKLLLMDTFNKSL